MQVFQIWVGLWTLLADFSLKLLQKSSGETFFRSFIVHFKLETSQEIFRTQNISFNWNFCLLIQKNYTFSLFFLNRYNKYVMFLTPKLSNFSLSSLNLKTLNFISISHFLSHVFLTTLSCFLFCRSYYFINFGCVVLYFYMLESKKLIDST